MTKDPLVNSIRDPGGDPCNALHYFDRSVAAQDSTPSPLYSGERAGVRGERMPIHFRRAAACRDAEKDNLTYRPTLIVH
jgi:hypothetical protein